MYDGRVVRPGDELEVPAEDAEDMIALNFAEPVGLKNGQRRYKRRDMRPLQ
jgi:hypothetical protein